MIKRFALVSCVWTLAFLTSCHENNDDGTKDVNRVDGVRTFIGKLTEVVKPDELFNPSDKEGLSGEWDKLHEGWKCFEYICKYQVIDSEYTDITTYAVYPVVITKQNIADTSFTNTIIGKDVIFQEGAVHYLTVTTDLPHGWEVIETDFLDERMGLLACIKVESAGKE